MPFRFNPFTKKLDLIDLTAIPPGTTVSLTGDVGGAVPPDAGGNINVVGGNDGILFTGNPGTNTLTLSLPGSGTTWFDESTNFTMGRGFGYFTTNTVGNITAALPAVATGGDTIKIISVAAGTFQITQPNAGDIILIGDLLTTTGTGGSLTSEKIGDGCTLVCANGSAGANFWVVIASTGNLLVT